MRSARGSNRLIFRFDLGPTFQIKQTQIELENIEETPHMSIWRRSPQVGIARESNRLILRIDLGLPFKIKLTQIEAESKDVDMAPIISSGNRQRVKPAYIAVGFLTTVKD